MHARDKKQEWEQKVLIATYLSFYWTYRKAIVADTTFLRWMFHRCQQMNRYCWCEHHFSLVSQVKWMIVLECGVPSALYISRDLHLHFYIITEQINSIIALPKSSGLYLLWHLLSLCFKRIKSLSFCILAKQKTKLGMYTG